MSHNSDFLNLVNDARSRVKECNIDDVFKKQQDGEAFVLVDCREDREWDAGRIQGAIHLGKGVIERDIAKHVADKDAEVIIYCGGGFRSLLAAENLQRMGYKNVISMDGGWRSWKEADYPTES